MALMVISMVAHKIVNVAVYISAHTAGSCWFMHYTTSSMSLVYEAMWDECVQGANPISFSFQ
jgi:dihydroxyacid dehydratase/phosphogluconate dehydratase